MNSYNLIPFHLAPYHKPGFFSMLKWSVLFVGNPLESFYKQLSTSTIATNNRLDVRLVLKFVHFVLNFVFHLKLH